MTQGQEKEQLRSEGRRLKSKHQIEQARVEQRARLDLQFFLAEDHRVIRAMRSYNQHLGILKQQNRLGELKEIEDEIEEKSQGRLHWFNGRLCEISDTGETFQYHDEFFPKFGEDVVSVRGFHFDCLIKGAAFECVDLDGGRSREHFDKKDNEGKRSFIKRFAERREDVGVMIVSNPHTWPWAFTAFIRDDNGKFIVEEIFAYRSLPPRPQK